MLRELKGKGMTSPRAVLRDVKMSRKRADLRNQEIGRLRVKNLNGDLESLNGDLESLEICRWKVKSLDGDQNILETCRLKVKSLNGDQNILEICRRNLNGDWRGR